MSRANLRRAGPWAAVFSTLWLLGGSANARADDVEEAALEEYDELYFDEDAEEDDAGDPWEPMNRGLFWVNDGLDRYAIEPVSKAWDFVLPDFAQRSLRNAFENLRFPIVFFNDLFQGKPKQAGQDLARFVLNSTVGIGGLLDPASTIGLKQRNEDFGQTLGYWGVPPGPYLMLPFFGPSSVRDGVGKLSNRFHHKLPLFLPATILVCTISRACSLTPSPSWTHHSDIQIKYYLESECVKQPK